MARMLESEEAARRLGIKLPTLYAYVSRGLLASHPSTDSRRRLFDVGEVEALSRRSRGGRRVESRLASVTTGITQIREDGPYYRGKKVASLASTATFEEVADLLWCVEPAPGEWTRQRLPRPPRLDPADLIRWVTVLCGAKDRLRADLRQEVVVKSARRLITTMVASLPPGDERSTSPGAGSTAQNLARHLAPTRMPAAARRELDEAVDTALVLLADHELATSTLAVRVAALTACRPLRRHPGRSRDPGRPSPRRRQPTRLRSPRRRRTPGRRTRRERMPPLAGEAAGVRTHRLQPR